MEKYRKSQLLISGIAFLAIIIHLFIPCIKLDFITLILICIGILPWTIHIFKSIELNGVGKIELQDIKGIRELTEKVKNETKTDNKKKNSKKGTDFNNLYESDPLLAFASIRIELEKKLNKLGTNIKRKHNSSIRGLILDLHKAGEISNNEYKLLNDIIPILNLAIHGQYFDMEASKWLIDNAPIILENLENKTLINKL